MGEGKNDSVERLQARLQAAEAQQLDDDWKAAALQELTAIAEELKLALSLDFREIGDHLYDGVYVADGTGKTLYINKAYTRITGIYPEEILGRSVEEILRDGLYSNAVTPEVIRQKKRVNSMGESLRNGRKMLITGSPIFNEAGDVAKVVVVDREITDLWAMKADLESSKQKIKAVEEDKEKGKQEIEHLRSRALNKNLIGQSRAMQDVAQAIEQVAGLEVTVLITGETGVGKEVVANEIYRNSKRCDGPFIKVNCAAIPPNLLEAELFGYEKGAFTGAATTGKLGMFELANQGTLLLDEIGDMPLGLQSKLLRVIQHREVTRIGATKPVLLDMRLIAATNCDLRDLVKQGKFREDLYYRLNVFPIEVPPLRLRQSDISLLVQHFLDTYKVKYNKEIGIDQAGFTLLKEYNWPGNIRELQNILERLIIISSHGSTVPAEQIGRLLHLDDEFLAGEVGEIGLKEVVAAIEKRTIERALQKYGSTRKAAKILGIDQSTIVKKAKKLGITLA
ncbi:MAG: sigma 54-interacting transcriptional regulator [Sporomusaceae bacterium]|nr:sigma 54-interacting transcriptional regulator [Sporomusaceae bacterium]